MKNRVIGITVGVVIVVAAIVGGLLWKRSYDHAQQPSASNDQQQPKEDQVQPNQLQITDEKVGDGDEAQTGKTVSVNYLGTLTNGTKFDSSYDRNQPFSFTLGGGQVIKGWDQGVVGMKVGGKRKLVIPADLAYGDQSPSAAIPPNSTLVFEIELLSVQ